MDRKRHPRRLRLFQTRCFLLFHSHLFCSDGLSVCGIETSRQGTAGRTLSDYANWKLEVVAVPRHLLGLFRVVPGIGITLAMGRKPTGDIGAACNPASGGKMKFATERPFS